MTKPFFFPIGSSNAVLSDADETRAWDAPPLPFPPVRVGFVDDFSALFDESGGFEIISGPPAICDTEAMYGKWLDEGEATTRLGRSDPPGYEP